MRFGPLYIAPRHLWSMPEVRACAKMHGPVYVFRNLSHVKPGRWGIGFFGLVEFGSRNPCNQFGVWLKKHGLWPW